MRGLASFRSIPILLAVITLQAAVPSPQSAVTGRIDSVFSGLIRPGDPGAAVLVKQDGKILFEKGYGVRDLRSQAKIDPETNFRLASVTKQFTAMAIMLVIHDGKLHYDDRLTDVFPDFAAYGKDITIRNLLNHTSGLRDYAELMEREEKRSGPKWSAEHQIQDDQVLALLKAQPSGLFVPGTRWEYSNSGYVVLGLIVAKVSGMPYRDFLQRRIFSPLKMNHTLVYEKGKNIISRRAFGHSKENDKLIETDQSPTSATLGDGGIYSNLEDLAKWDEALAKHTLLDEKEMQPALTAVKLADGSEPHWPRDPHASESADPPAVMYGFGWFLDPYQGHPRDYHDGGTQGFRTTIQRFVNDHITIVVLSNRTDLNPDELALKVADIVFATH
ncbi:MAG TPA: serine hydrolase domain-containing protein [Candidatus Acidoferrum sp.]|nr:serine hydrolase domain-containing protein [Candidatus Acidoferrum sp.]